MDYLVATIKPWNLEAFRQNVAALPGCWHLVSSPTELEKVLRQGLVPRYIFFPHWSWKVPAAITDAFECVCFHMADVPFGRGGSPLQNLIVRGFDRTKLTALRMAEELDAGPVYAKVDLSLEGTAQQIFGHAAERVYELIHWIVANEPQPQPQEGEAVVFARRTPEQSVLPQGGSLKQLYDHIRMLDAESYPHGFIEYGSWRLEFSKAEWNGDELVAQVLIRKSESKG